MVWKITQKNPSELENRTGKQEKQSVESLPLGSQKPNQSV